MHKVLVVGAGGTGEIFARIFQNDARRRLRQLGWERDMPAAWRAIVIDVAQKPDPARPGTPTGLGSTGRRVPLAASPFKYKNYFDRATAAPASWPALVGSLADRDVAVPPPFKGAGGRPQVGYAVGVSELPRIAEEIDRELALMDSPQARDELAELTRVTRIGDPEEEPGTIVMIVSSLGGGGGASLLPLLCELLAGRATAGAHFLASELTTLLFTPDVFVEFTAAEKRSLNANALSTVCTMINGYEAPGQLPDELAQLLAPAGVTILDAPRVPRTNFFVGVRNSHIAFDHHEKVVEAAAKAVLTWVTDARVAKGLEAHLDANRFGLSVTSELRITDTSATSRMASSIGRARVSRGEETFEDYLAERIAKRALEIFLRGQRGMGVTRSEREDAIIERVGREQGRVLVARCRLRDGDVRNELESRETLKSSVQAVVRRLNDDRRSQNRRTTAEHWGAAINRECKTAFGSFAADDDERRTAAAARWGVDAEARVRDAVTELVARYGVPITIRALDEAQGLVREGAGEIERSRSEQLPLVATLRERASELLATAKRTIRSRDAVLDETTERLGKAAFVELEVEHKTLAARLLRDLAQSVLQPLRQALAEAAAQLVEAETGQHKELVTAWSTRELSKHLVPAANEILLTPLNTVPELADRLLEQTLGIDGPANAEAEGVVEILTGVYPAQAGGVLEHKHLIEPTRVWRAASSAPALYSIRIDPPEFLHRARRWVGERRGAIGDWLRQPLSEWIDASPRNADHLADAVDLAVSYAEPLVNVNPLTHLYVHGVPPQAPKLYATPLPIAADHRIRARIERTLREAGLEDAAIADAFDPTSATTDFEVCAFMATPVHPLAVSSIWLPIQRDWQARTSEGMQEQFAEFRRTRPLPLWLPLSRDRQVKFVMGWLAAELLGYLDPLDAPWSEHPLTVWSPAGRLRFPERLLAGDVKVQGEVLARVLESMPLAWASYGSENPDALKAYVRVLDLGDMEALLRWAVQGRTEDAEPEGPPAPEPDYEVAGWAAGMPAERSEAMIATLETFLAGYGAHLNRVQLTRATLTKLRPWHEIRALVEEAVTRLCTALQAAGETPSGGQVPAITRPRS